MMRYKTNLKGVKIETPQSKEESPKTSMNEGDRSHSRCNNPPLRERRGALALGIEGFDRRERERTSPENFRVLRRERAWSEEEDDERGSIILWAVITNGPFMDESAEQLWA